MLDYFVYELILSMEEELDGAITEAETEAYDFAGWVNGLTATPKITPVVPIAELFPDMKEWFGRAMLQGKPGEETPEATCAGCEKQDESKAAISAIGVTYCEKKFTHVPLAGETCSDFVHKRVGEGAVAEAGTEADDTYVRTVEFPCGDSIVYTKAATLAERTKTIAETISDLESQKSALLAANEELKDLVKNCHACDTHVQVIDSYIEENDELRDRNTHLARKNDELRGKLNASEKNRSYLESVSDAQELAIGEFYKDEQALRDRNTSLIKEKKEVHGQLLAEKSWRVRMHSQLEYRKEYSIHLAHTINALQGTVQEQAECIEKNRENLRKHYAMLNEYLDNIRRGEEEYMRLYQGSVTGNLTPKSYEVILAKFREKINGK